MENKRLHAYEDERTDNMYKKRAKQFLCFLLSLCLAGTIAFGEIGSLPGLNTIAYADGEEGDSSEPDTAGDPQDPDYSVDSSLCDHDWVLKDSGECYYCSHCTMTVGKGNPQFCEIMGTHVFESNGVCKNCDTYDVNSDITHLTVTFMNGDVQFAASAIQNGGTVSAPATDPTKDGCTFAYWTLNPDNPSAFDFSTSITQNITLYAYFGEPGNFSDLRTEIGNTENGGPLTLTRDYTAEAGEGGLTIPSDKTITISNGKDTDFFFIERDEPEAAAEEIVGLVCRRLPKHYGLDSRDIQVLTPMHRGVVGAAKLNEMLQKAVNPNTESITRNGCCYRLQDKVMQIRNNYDKDIFNGDIGTIVNINMEDRELIVNFDGRQVAYDATDLDELVLAYATSIHKSQGSEYPIVIIPISVRTSLTATTTTAMMISAAAMIIPTLTATSAAMISDHKGGYGYVREFWI